MTDLEWVSQPPPAVKHPVMVVALAGLFDPAEVSTSAVSWLSAHRVVETIASIDPDRYFDFLQHRPNVALIDGMRVITWPTNEFVVVRDSASEHDLVLLSGVEPDVRWRSFVDAVTDVVLGSGCELVVTVGAFPEPVPHTRTPLVFGSSGDARLAARLGLSRPQYQGPTGVVGVLHERLERHRIPTIALRVGIPHYLGGAQHPRATMALLAHLEHVLGFPTYHDRLAGEVDRWRMLHDEAVGSDPQASAFVTMLEREFDRRAEAAMPSAEDLGAAFESFLSEQRDGDLGDSDQHEGEQDDPPGEEPDGPAPGG